MTPATITEERGARATPAPLDWPPALPEGAGAVEEDWAALLVE